MIPKGLFLQIAMVIASVGIIFTYIQPKFDEVGNLQDDIIVYQEQREKINSVNAKLDALVSSLNMVSNDDKRRLLSYLPDEVDPIKVQRDLLIITQEAGVIYNGTSYDGDSSSQNRTRSRAQSQAEVELDPTLVSHDFALSVSGTYEQFKDLFTQIEQNNYPLEIHDMSISTQEGGFLDAQISLVTYSYDDQLTE